MIRLYISMMAVCMLFIYCSESKKDLEEEKLIGLTETFKNIDLLSRGYDKYSLRLNEIEDTLSVTLSFLYHSEQKRIEFLEYYPSKEMFIDNYSKSNLPSLFDNADYSESSLNSTIIELFTKLSSIGATSTSQEFKELGIDRVFYLKNDDDRIYFIDNLEEVSNEEWLLEISQSNRIGSKFYYSK